MASERQEVFVPGQTVFQKIVLVALCVSTLAYLVYTLAEGTANARFIQVGMVVGVLAYLATFVDVVLGLAFLIACVGFSPEMSMAGMHHLRIEDFIIPALLLAWLTREAERREPLVAVPFKGPALLYFVAMLASTLLGAASGTTKPEIGLLILGKFVEYYLIFLIVANNVRTPGEFKALLLFAVVVAMAGPLLGFARPDATGGTPVGFQRVFGPSGETSNIYGGYLILYLSVAAGLYLHATTTSHRFAAGVALVFLSGGLLYTYSRTSYVSQLAALGIFGVLKARRLLIILVLLVAVFPLLAPDEVFKRASTIMGIFDGSGNPSWDARTDAWKLAVGRMSGTDFLWGKGVGAVKFGDVDSEYVRILVDTGILGLGAFVWFLVRLGVHAGRLYDSLAPAGLFKGYAAGFMTAYFGLIVHGLAATSFSSIRTMESFMILTGLTACLASRCREWELILPNHELRTTNYGPEIPASVRNS